MKHECKYWDYNLRWNYRKCKFCGRMQLNYGGKWKDRICGLGWLEKYMKLGSTDFKPQIEIQVDFPFEYGGHYENWNTFFTVKIGDKVFGPFDNFNIAEYLIDKELSQTKGGKGE